MKTKFVYDSQPSKLCRVQKSPQHLQWVQLDWLPVVPHHLQQVDSICRHTYICLWAAAIINTNLWLSTHLLQASILNDLRLRNFCWLFLPSELGINLSRNSFFLFTQVSSNNSTWTTPESAKPCFTRSVRKSSTSSVSTWPQALGLCHNHISEWNGCIWGHASKCMKQLCMQESHE